MAFLLTETYIHYFRVSKDIANGLQALIGLKSFLRLPVKTEQWRGWKDRCAGKVLSFC